jgi:hypothetical protein
MLKVEAVRTILRNNRADRYLLTLAIQSRVQPGRRPGGENKSTPTRGTPMEIIMILQ